MFSLRSLSRYSSPLVSSFYQIPHRYSWVFRPHFDYSSLLSSSASIIANVANRKARTANPSLVFSLIQRKNSLESSILSLKPSQDRLTDLVKRTKNNEERRNAIEQAKSIKAEIQQYDSELTKIIEELELETSKLPNFTHENTPIGSESCGKVLELVHPIPLFNFKPLSHVELAKKHHLIDFEQASKISGSRFYYLLNEVSLLELALIHYSIQFFVSKGFSPILPPDLVHSHFLVSLGFQPRDTAETQIYHLEKDWNLSLVGTAEIPMVGFYTNKIVQRNKLPMKSVSFGHAFRTEAGGLGRENKGLYRVHQFSKVELFYVSSPEQSNENFNELVQLQKEFFQSLGLHFRVLEIATEDLGNSAHRKIDCEALMPGKGLESAEQSIMLYGEISSASNCTDYQARRVNIRMDDGSGKPINDPKRIEQLEFAHTLNGTACAVPRLIVAILEQCQKEDGTIEIPKVLHPFMMGVETIPSNKLRRVS
jgi:seryl-tRNA synthetase